MNIKVTESSKNIRLLARQALDGNWKKATLTVIIYMVCIMAPVMILEFLFGSLNPENLEAAMYSTSTEMYAGSTIASAYTLLVTGAFTFGMTLFFIQMIRTKNSEYGNVFAGFGYFFKTLGLYFMMSLFVFLWMLLLIVPGIIASFRYSQAFYILADDPTKGVMQCIRESKEMMKGNKAKIFCLELSFIPWILLAYLAFVIILSIGVVIPYVGIAIMIVGMIGFLVVVCVLVAYMMGATTIFYDMITGRLRSASEMPPLSDGHEPLQ